MDPTISVSKGVFVFKNGATRAAKTTKKSSKRTYKATASVLGKDMTTQPFYEVYAETWRCLKSHIEQLQQRSYKSTMDKLVDFVANANSNHAETYGMLEILPTAVLLTGINQPDHFEQFETLTQRINEKISASICVLQSRDCSSLKGAVESLVYNFVEAPHDDNEDNEDNEDRDHKRLRRSNCTMKQLKHWYRNNFPLQQREKTTPTSANATPTQSHTLVVILPDFECFNSCVLQDLILILSAHCAELPFVLVAAVATTVSTVHNTLPYHVTSKIKLRVFQTQAAPVGLNEILERVILSPKYAFHLSGKTFKFLTHIFLYYDFSINGFIQGFKYCLMEHFFQGNAYSLCTSYAASLNRIQTLTHDDMETIRRLLSFRPYVESINDCKRIISILTDDNYLKRKLPQLLRDCHVHFMLLRTFLEFLAALVDDLPNCPLGKQRRELYAFCLAKDLCTQAEFKECWQMLAFMSKTEFTAKISKAIAVTQDFAEKELLPLELGASCLTIVKSKLSAIEALLSKVSSKQQQVEKTTHNASDQLQQLASRHDLKERLLQMSKAQKPTSDFAKSVNEILAFIQTEIVAIYLKPLEQAPPLHELFVFTDIATVRRHIIGTPRAALHMALNNPHFYLQCKCCQLRESTQLLATLPDLSIVYKLHLECGRMINLFDWLQAFRSLVDSSDNDQQDNDGAQLQEQIDPQIQARFTRAVAELQFLGYIKMSKRKTDHVTRMTW